MGQEPILFSGTVGDNIAYGIDSELRAKVEYLKDGDIRAQVVEAAKVILHRYLCYILWMVKWLENQLANAHDFIMEFPDGYDTDVV